MLTTSVENLRDNFESKQTGRVLLEPVSWQTYQKLLSELGDHRTSRFAYDQGYLEITMPLELHETIKRLLERIVDTLTEELNLDVKSFGSTTLNREDIERSAEPDSCFYIQNADRIQGRKLDLEINPPPDLVIEVDLTSSSSRRLKIYSDLGVPEIWQYTKKGMTINRLDREGKQYLVCEFSPTFSIVSAAVLDRLLAMAETENDGAIIRSLRTWIREQV